MPDKKLVEGKLGTVGAYEVDFTGGQLIAKASASADGATFETSVTISGKSILDGIAAKIGGPIPEAVAAFLESSLGLK